MQAKYDTAKWFLYCIYCDDTCKFQNHLKIENIVTFGMLDLKFEGLNMSKDTLELFFNFYYDTVKCDFLTIKNTISTGVSFERNNNNISYYLSSSTLNIFYEKGPTSRYANPIQLEVISYLRNHKQKLAPWFRSEAQKRGLLL